MDLEDFEYFTRAVWTAHKTRLLCLFHGAVALTFSAMSYVLVYVYE